MSTSLTKAELQKIAVQCRGQLMLMPEASIGLMLNGTWGKND